MPLTTTECANLLNQSTLATSYPWTTGPTKLALLTAQSGAPATTAGTEVTGGAGPYARQTCTFTSTSTGTIVNTSVITFSGMPACTVPYFELYDSAATPNRKWYGSLTTSRTLQAGDSIQFSSGSVALGLA